MKTLFILLITIVFAGIVSCANIEIKAEKKHNKIEELYQKYKTMIKENPSCSACYDCAGLALSIKYDNKKEIAAYKQKLIKYYKTNDSIPCPEFVGEVKKSK